MSARAFCQSFGMAVCLGYNQVRKSVREVGVALELNKLTARWPRWARPWPRCATSWPAGLTRPASCWRAQPEVSDGTEAQDRGRAPDRRVASGCLPLGRSPGRALPAAVAAQDLHPHRRRRQPDLPRPARHRVVLSAQHRHHRAARGHRRGAHRRAASPRSSSRTPTSTTKRAGCARRNTSAHSATGARSTRWPIWPRPSGRRWAAICPCRSSA